MTPTAMFSRKGSRTNANRRKLPQANKAVDALVALADGNPDKALVMVCIGQLIAAGHAEWEMRDSGEVEVRFTSGEAYLLTETMVLRLT